MLVRVVDVVVLVHEDGDGDGVFLVAQFYELLHAVTMLSHLVFEDHCFSRVRTQNHWHGLFRRKCWSEGVEEQSVVFLAAIFGQSTLDQDYFFVFPSEAHVRGVSRGDG